MQFGSRARARLVHCGVLALLCSVPGLHAIRLGRGVRHGEPFSYWRSVNTGDT